MAKERIITLLDIIADINKKYNSKDWWNYMDNTYVDDKGNVVAEIAMDYEGYYVHILDEDYFRKQLKDDIL